MMHNLNFIALPLFNEDILQHVNVIGLEQFWLNTQSELTNLMILESIYLLWQTHDCLFAHPAGTEQH